MSKAQRLVGHQVALGQAWETFLGTISTVMADAKASPETTAFVQQRLREHLVQHGAKAVDPTVLSVALFHALAEVHMLRDIVDKHVNSSAK